MARPGQIRQAHFEPVGSNVDHGINSGENSSHHSMNFFRSSYNSTTGSSSTNHTHGPPFADRSSPNTDTTASSYQNSIRGGASGSQPAYGYARQWQTQSQSQSQPQQQPPPLRQQQPPTGAPASSHKPSTVSGTPKAPAVAPPEMGELAQLMVLELQQRCTEQRHAELSFQSVFHSTHVPSISMWDYVRRIAKYSGCTPECFIFSIILIDRYCAATGIPTTFRNIHRLSITAVMISAKLRDDVYYSNAYYASIGGVSNRELNHLEMEMLATINWFTWVEPSHYDGLLEHLKQVYGSFISPQKGH